MGVLGVLGYRKAAYTETRMKRMITILTDFGLQDGYVAAVKGVIDMCLPQTRVIDITHQISPQNVRSAAFILSTVVPYFSSETVHLAVVDPGVGTARRLLAVKTPKGFFVAPDNGLLSLVLKPYIMGVKADGTLILSSQVQTVEINNQEYFSKRPSATFAGRDILAPVAAALCAEVNITQLGSPVAEIMGLGIEDPVWQDDILYGEILHIDHFGNVITNIRKTDLPKGKSISVQLGRHSIIGLSCTYSDKAGLLALIQSNGYLEIAFNGGSAQKATAAQVAQKVQICINKP